MSRWFFRFERFSDCLFSKLKTHLFLDLSEIDQDVQLEVSWNRATPSYPFIEGLFHEINQPFWGSPDDYGTSQLLSCLIVWWPNGYEMIPENHRKPRYVTLKHSADKVANEGVVDPLLAGNSWGIYFQYGIPSGKPTWLWKITIFHGEVNSKFPASIAKS